jgi:hypothetical protein
MTMVMVRRKGMRELFDFTPAALACKRSKSHIRRRLLLIFLQEVVDALRLLRVGARQAATGKQIGEVADSFLFRHICCCCCCSSSSSSSSYSYSYSYSFS